MAEIPAGVAAQPSPRKLDTIFVAIYLPAVEFSGTDGNKKRSIGPIADAARFTICRELTKRHEEKLQMTLTDSLSYYEVNEPRGEYVLIIAGRSREEMKKEEQAGWEALSLEEHMAHYESQGIDRKEAMKRVAKDRGVSKRDIYQALLK